MGMGTKYEYRYQNRYPGTGTGTKLGWNMGMGTGTMKWVWVRVRTPSHVETGTGTGTTMGTLVRVSILVLGYGYGYYISAPCARPSCKTLWCPWLIGSGGRFVKRDSLPNAQILKFSQLLKSKHQMGRVQCFETALSSEVESLGRTGDS